MSDAKSVLQEFVDQAWNERHPDACDIYLVPEYRHFIPGQSDPMIGPEGYKGLIAAFTGAFPDLRMRIVDIFGDDERACAVWVIEGTQTGDFNGLAASGRSISLRGVAVATARNGKLIEVISSYDSQELASQLSAG